MQTKHKVLLGVGAVVVAGLVGAGIGAVYFPEQVTVTQTVTQIKEVPVEVIKEVPVTVEVEKEVLVDNGNLATVMDFVENNVDEDLTVDYMVFEIDAQAKAEAYVKENLIDLLSDEDFFDDGATLDQYRKSEVSVYRVSDAVISDRDIEDKDVTLQYEVKVKAKEDGEDREYFFFNVTIPFEDGELVADDVEVDLV